jgi:tellurite resistance protein TerC
VLEISGLTWALTIGLIVALLAVDLVLAVEAVAAQRA